MTLRDRAVAALAAVPVWSSRHARAVAAAYLLLTLVMLQGASTLRFEDNVQEILPRGNPHTLAAQNVSERFPTNYYITAVNLVIDPDKWAAHNAKLPHRVSEERPANVTDEVYVRGIEEFNRFFLAHVPSAHYNITLDSYVRLINYTNTATCVHADAGLCATTLDPEAFRRLPPTTPRGEQQYEQAWQTVWTASPQTVQAVVGPGWNTTRNVFLFDPAPGQTTRDVGLEIIRGWQAYKAWAPEHARWDVFDLENSHVDPGQPTVLDAHTSELTAEDVRRLGPLVAAFIAAALWLAFRNGRSIVAAGATLAVGAAWTFGLMGYLRIPLNTLNLSLVPLLLGNGIDYAIHVVNELMEHKRDGATDAEAFEMTGRRAGVALLIASLTTASGMLIMALSPSTLMAQVGLVSAVGMAVVFAACLTLLPALLTLLGTDALGGAFRESRLMPRLTTAVARRRAVAALLVVTITVAAVASSQRLTVETYGNPALNFPEGDWAREAQRKENVYLFGSEDPEADWATNFLVFEGDVTDPEFHSYLRNLTAALEAAPFVRDNSVVGLDYVLEQWQLLKGGTAGAAIPLAREQAQPGSTYPDTREDIEGTLDEVFASPLATYAALFVDPDDYRTTVTVVEINQGSTYEETAAVWSALWQLVDEVDRAHGRPGDVQVHLYGFTATSYLFVKEELPWVRHMAVGAFVVVTGLVAFFTRDPKATLAVAALVGLTSVWWTGLLPLLGVGVSVGLMLPMAFIMSIGSDYAVHLTWNLRRSGEHARRVWATTGKAVLYSAVTDGGAFALFALMQYVLMQRVMLATSAAILTIFACTVLVLPLFYRREMLEEEAGEGEKVAEPAAPRARA